MVTIIILSKTEKYLDNTIRDILENATGEIEVLVGLDGYETEHIEGVTYFQIKGEGENHKRQGINQGVAMAKGEYVMWVDAHCLFAKGFDEQLVKDSQPNWVQIPRRNRLDAENWCLQDQGDDRPPIDYEYFMFAPLARGEGLHGYKWDLRTIERADIMIDDTIEFQGSCVFMTKDWFTKMGFMDLRYSGWGSEAEEVGLTTWKNGGRVVTNKNTYYAHLHKGKKYGRMYHLNQGERQQSWDYARNLWLNENKEFFISLIERFMPMPSWPSDWKERIWKS
jgi:GT2 family glycosyltransferase